MGKKQNKKQTKVATGAMPNPMGNIDMGLHIAIGMGDLDGFKQMVEQGAQMEGCDMAGNTLLHTAILGGHTCNFAPNNVGIVKQLVEGKADPCARNIVGVSPLSYCAKLEYMEGNEMFNYLAQSMGLNDAQQGSLKAAQPIAHEGEGRQNMLQLGQLNSQKCGVCMAPAETRCARCKLVSYCTADCQKVHWKRHKTVCILADNPSTSVT
mmetsp:Transcript_69469/g.122624  ORF Transcript_69469/g.122624 Transcript_69469/m.122624 type:complete len:209 (-) Transcript_69469:612-1238(-)